jgi:N-acetylglucosaminyl-diphospho-decaprenol L-rhamnosyltransferase
MALLALEPALQKPAPRRLRRRQNLAPPALAMPLVSVVIVNYRRWDETSALVDQIFGPRHIHRGDVEVIVVDNDSQSDPLEDQLKGRRGVRVVRLPRNVGFSAGVNAGCRISRGEWVLVLNPDVVVCQGFVDLLCGAVRDLRDDHSLGAPVGVVGFRLHNRDGSWQLSTGRFPHLPGLLLGLLRPRQTRKYFLPTAGHRQRVPWVTGSCLLLKRQCLDDVQGFDEDYFLYYEDVDLCRRALDRGWAVCFEPAVAARHMEPLQNRQLTEPLRAITRHAALTYFRKHLARWQFFCLTAIVKAEARLREWIHLRRGRRAEAQMMRLTRRMAQHLRRHQPLAARAELQAILQLAGMARPNP